MAKITYIQQEGFFGDGQEGGFFFNLIIFVEYNLILFIFNFVMQINLIAQFVPLQFCFFFNTSY